ncbi:MAG: rubrerythrin [Bacteroidales bacterium]|nr:rubrerythrin [Bacteroidales bacterium]
MTNRQRKELLKAQQGELDAVPMYNALADVAKHERDKETFRQLAKEEGRHASVFHAYTGEVLQPKMLKARLLPILYKIAGRKILYPVIAKFEYNAARGYEHLIPDFPEVASVRDDETRHGDTVKALLD